MVIVVWIVKIVDVNALIADAATVATAAFVSKIEIVQPIELLSVRPSIEMDLWDAKAVAVVVAVAVN